MSDVQYKFGCDWINGVLPITDVRHFQRFLTQLCPKLNSFLWCHQNNGMYNYSERYTLNGNSIQYMYNPQPNCLYKALSKCDTGCNYGIFISISGDGIRYLNSLDPYIIPRLFRFLARLEFRCTRFDVYCDILDKDNKGVPALREAFYYFTAPRAHKTTLKTELHRTPQNIKRLPEEDFNGKRYMNFQLGNHGSNAGMFRCYNKLDETFRKHSADEFAEITQKYGVTDYWYRMEYELHKDRANQIFYACVDTYNRLDHSFDFAGLWFTACEYFFTVVQCTNNITVRNCDTSLSWQDFLSTIAHIIHFVQLEGGSPFESVPYVPRGVEHYKTVLSRSPAYVYFMLELYERDEDFRKLVISEGRQRFMSDERYRIRRDEFYERGVV